MKSPRKKKPIGGRTHRQRGDREERRLVNVLQEAGFAAERLPTSGSKVGTPFGGYDISLPLMGIDRKVEVKHHGTLTKSPFNKLYQYLDGRDMLIVRRDHSDPIVIINWDLALLLMLAAERAPRL